MSAPSGSTSLVWPDVGWPVAARRPSTDRTCRSVRLEVVGGPESSAPAGQFQRFGGAHRRRRRPLSLAEPRSAGPPRTGLGLTSMAERVHGVDGTFEARARDGRWVVRWTLPRPAAADGRAPGGTADEAVDGAGDRRRADVR